MFCLMLKPEMSSCSRWLHRLHAHVPIFCFPVPAFLYKFLFFVVQGLRSRASRAFQILLTFLRGKYFGVPTFYACSKDLKQLYAAVSQALPSPRTHIRVYCSVTQSSPPPPIQTHGGRGVGRQQVASGLGVIRSRRIFCAQPCPETMRL